MVRMPSIGMAGVALAALLVSAGCTAGGTPARDLLDREQTADDVIDIAEVFEYSDIDPETTRFIGEREGVRFYYTTAPDAPPGNAECLTAVPANQEWMSACSGSGGEMYGIGVGTVRWDFGGGAQAELAEDEVAVGDYVIAVLVE